MSFDSKAFSLKMKTAFADYMESGQNHLDVSDHWFEELSGFNTKSLSTDSERLAFWINLYNGLTNFQIVKNGLKKSVWELPGFFSERHFQVGAFSLSLDDIEHGILRRNGPRKNDKPRQFQQGDPRQSMMVDRLDPRIHFALNCGAVSCPPIAFYTAENIDEELALAEENFVSQEFLVDHENRKITCSELFVWYRTDFPESFLSAPELVEYQVNTIPYQWEF